MPNMLNYYNYSPCTCQSLDLLCFTLSIFLGHLPCKAGQEPGDVGIYRRKLINFLHRSTNYVPERLLTRFPLDGMLFIQPIDIFMVTKILKDFATRLINRFNLYIKISSN